MNYYATNRKPLAEVIEAHAGFATWEQRAVDMALGGAAGSLLSTILFVVLVRAFVTPRARREPLHPNPCEPVK